MNLNMIVPFVLLCGCSHPFGFPAGYGSSNECVDSDDCKRDELCIGPNQSNCGIQFDGECNIYDDTSCGVGLVCKALTGACMNSSTGDCIPDCRVDGCSTGRCDETTGMCNALRCNEEGGAACPALFTCIDGQGGGPGGCERIACDRDSDCPGDNTCWNSQCHESASVCSLAAP